jgi:glycosyltransferase involved in cell wall biosynthesis
VTPFLQASDIAICPIEFGGGTKVKLLESMSAGLPTVVFEETIQGLDVVSGEHLWVVDKNEEAILAVLDAFVADNELTSRLGDAARRYVCVNHEWRQIAEHLESVLLRLVERTQAMGERDLAVR